ncbi:hypothetical protein GCM10018793_68750 [Streptomyces sulfonofaciens]|uniref:DUF3099 domain-containing protein n=1 Tax=Streptomyces sulfonofaciens TaxID=68272 RepID=A0A919GQX2_9ACTN|nr:DUF3099 domain-containing protein [Streptomyces sulfonofaciens]GHH88578.1 hypothetical protein GCM10018793_68750 [Streptomyces sulfonofaciens]
MRKQRKAEVFRITGARQGLNDDVRGRQRRYVISMVVRTISVILAITLWNVAQPVAIVALVLGFILPYIAVVIANAGRENAPSQPPTFVPTPSRPMLTDRAQRPAAEQAAHRPPSSEAAAPSGPEGSGVPTAPSPDSGSATTATPDPSGSAPQDHT